MNDIFRCIFIFFKLEPPRLYFNNSETIQPIKACRIPLENWDSDPNFGVLNIFVQYLWSEIWPKTFVRNLMNQSLIYFGSDIFLSEKYVVFNRINIWLTYVAFSRIFYWAWVTYFHYRTPCNKVKIYKILIIETACDKVRL